MRNFLWDAEKNTEFEGMKGRAREVVQWLRALPILAKDQALVPNIHMAAHNYFKPSSQKSDIIF